MFNRLLTLCLIFLVALPAQARFLTQDQWEGDVNNPPSLHKYVYTYQNPTKYTDPSGNIPLLLGLALVGAEIGFFTDFLAQEYETGATSVTDFVKNDYDVKRGAVNTTIGGVSGLAGGGLVNAGISTARAATASVLFDSTLDEAGKTVLTGNAPTAKGFATSAALNTAFFGSSQLGGAALDIAKPYLNKAKSYLPTNRNSSTTINVEGSSGPNNQSVAMITVEGNPGQPSAVPLSSTSQVDQAQQRQLAMLQQNQGYNISPTAWDSYPTIGRNGTYISDQQGMTDIIGDFSTQSQMALDPTKIRQLEEAYGLEPGSLAEGFKVREVNNIVEQMPRSPMEGNEYFLGPGNHLPDGAPEMVIDSIPTQDTNTVETILEVLSE